MSDPEVISAAADAVMAAEKGLAMAVGWKKDKGAEPAPAAPPAAPAPVVINGITGDELQTAAFIIGAALVLLALAIVAHGMLMKGALTV